MSVLTWWLIPLVATISAIVVISVANRPRGPGPSDRSVEEFQRFRTALEQQIQEQPQGSRGVAGRDDTHGSPSSQPPETQPGPDRLNRG